MSSKISQGSLEFVDQKPQAVRVLELEIFERLFAVFVGFFGVISGRYVDGPGCVRARAVKYTLKCLPRILSVLIQSAAMFGD